MTEEIHPLMGRMIAFATRAGEDPGAFVLRGRERASDVRKSDIGDGGVEHFHERAHRDDEGDDPGIESAGAGSFDGEGFARLKRDPKLEFRGARRERGLGAIQRLFELRF